MQKKTKEEQRNYDVDIKPSTTMPQGKFHEGEQKREQWFKNRRKDQK